MTGLARLDELIEELEASPDDETSRRVYQALRAVLEVQREAFARVVEILRAGGHADVVDRLMEDPLLENILRGYRLVEVDLEKKVGAVLESLGREGQVRLLAVQSGVARLEAEGGPDEWLAVKKEVESAVRAAVPELVGLTVARRDPRSAPREARALPVLGARTPEPAGWLPLVHWWSLEQENRQKVPLFERELLVCAAGGRAYAFENRCPAGDESLETGLLEGFILTCPAHGLAFDLRSGRCMERQELVLPLLSTKLEEGIVKVEALPGNHVQ